jgi:hypothetical protein
MGGMTPPLAPAADLRPVEDLVARADSITALAALLLEWRADCERQLRGLTNLQRWLERIRSNATGDGERELLLQEMERLLGEAPPQNDDWTRQARTHLDKITG